MISLGNNKFPVWFGLVNNKCQRWYIDGLRWHLPTQRYDLPQHTSLGDLGPGQGCCKPAISLLASPLHIPVIVSGACVFVSSHMALCRTVCVNNGLLHSLSPASLSNLCGQDTIYQANFSAQLSKQILETAFNLSVWKSANLLLFFITGVCRSVVSTVILVPVSDPETKSDVIVFLFHLVHQVVSGMTTNQPPLPETNWWIYCCFAKLLS